MKKDKIYMSIQVLGRPRAVLRFMNVGLSFDGTEGFCSTEFGTGAETKVMKGSVHGDINRDDYRKLERFMENESYIRKEDKTRD